jgi:4-amino-4-deoxy-L-arabinose transferase-like glycosyltransferase
MDRTDTGRLVALLAFAAFLFLVNVWGYDLWPPDEPRFGEVAREMILSGDPVTLHVNGEFYKEKPPLLFWLIAGASLPGADEVTAFTARVPSVLAALWTVLLTFLLARRLFDERTAFWAGVILATTGLFWWEARSVRTDMLLTACTTAALYTFWRWHETHAGRWLAAFYAAIAAALLAKGPPGLVFPLLLIAAFHWGQREERRRMHWVAGVLMAAVPVLVWFVLASRNAPAAGLEAEQVAMGENLFRQTIGRFVLGVSKAQPPWYFLEVLPVDLLPWTIFLPWTVLWTWRRRHDGPAMRLLLSWTLPALVFFSISIGKRAVYILPLYPAFAILFARSILDLAASERVRWRCYTALAWAVLLLVVAAAPVAVRFSEYRDTWHPGFLGLTLVAVILAVDALRRARQGAERLHAAVAAGIGLVLVVASMIALPAVNVHKSAREFTAPLRALSREGVDYRLYSLGFSREEYVFYAERFHEPVLTDLLPLELAEPMDLRAMADLQRRVKKGMVEVVKDVPVADWRAVTPEEVNALRAALERGVAEAEVDPKSAEAFEKALAESVERFRAEFEPGGPAFFFVQEEDWRWLLAVDPQLRELAVMQLQDVGSRSVLLVANDAGAALLAGEGEQAGNDEGPGYSALRMNPRLHSADSFAKR